MTTNNKHHGIYIDPEALESTIVFCEKEQANFIHKHNTSLFQILMRCLALEMRYYLVFSIIGLLLILFLSIHNPKDALSLISIYCLAQGMFIIFELYKSHHYQLNEITSPVYLHPGRMLLIRSASIGLVNILIFAILSFFVLLFIPEKITSLIVFLLIPIYLLQIVMIYIVPYIHSLVAALICYCLLICSSWLFYKRFNIETTLTFALLQLAIIMTIFVVSLLRMYFKQKGGSHGTFITTH